jgi:hypothetical protein
VKYGDEGGGGCPAIRDSTYFTWMSILARLPLIYFTGGQWTQNYYGREVLPVTTVCLLRLESKWKAASDVITSGTYCDIFESVYPVLSWLERMNGNEWAAAKVKLSLFLTKHCALKTFGGVDVISPTPRLFYTQKTPQCPLDRRPGGPQSRGGRYGKVTILDHTGTRTPTPRSLSP